MKKNKIVLLLLIIGSPLFATFNNIQDGDDVLASPIMQNFRHVNYGTALKPVDSSGNNDDDNLDLGTNTVRWKDFYYSSQIFSPDGSAANPSISNLDDADTGIFYPAANSIGFSTSGSEAFRVDSNGHLEFDTNTLYIDASNNRIGVGISTPLSALDVDGTFTSRSTTSFLRAVDNSFLLASGGDASNSGANISLFGETHDTYSNKVRFRAGGTETVWIDSDGDIGVGTDSPDSHIHIRKSEVPVLKLHYSGLRAYTLSVTGGSASDGLSFTDASGATELARITRDGDFINYTGDIVAESGYGSFSDGIKAGGTTSLKMKVLDIGDWDMDTTEDIDVSHGLGDEELIRMVDVMIRDDTSSNTYPLDSVIGVDYGIQIPPTVEYLSDVQGGIAKITSANIRLVRIKDGFFDDSFFNSTSYNRGWVTIWYE